MVKKLAVLTVIFAVLCFAGVGCFRRGVYGGVHEGLYYDGPYRIGGGEYYYYNGGFYNYDRGAYRFSHHAPQEKRGYYDERYRKHHEQYYRNYPQQRDEHSGHPEQSPRHEDRRE